MGIFGTAKAQISVTATAGTLGPTAYTTLKAAFDAINAGTHQGDIAVSVTGNTTESATAILNASVPPASYTRVVIKPDAAGRVITGNLSPSIIKLNGSDKVTFDGSSTVGGTTRDLTISNTSTSTNTAIIWLASASGTDGATNDTVKNCIVTGSGPTATFIGIAQCSGTSIGGIAETANSNNTYSNNAISAAQYGIGVVGPGGNEDAQTVISGNTIGSAVAGSKMGHGGMFLAQQKKYSCYG